MRQTILTQEEQSIKPFQRRVLVGFSGFILAVTQLVGGIFVIYYQIFITSRSNMLPFSLLLLGFSALFYFLLPIPVCFYIAYQTRQSRQGRKAGETIGCLGAVFAVLFGIAALFIGITHDVMGLGTFGFFLLGAFTFINFLGFCLTPAGSAVGSAMGIAFRKRQGS